MPSGSVRPSTALGRLLREKRNELGLTLAQVSDALNAAGERIPLSTLARIEQGKLDPGARRLHLLLRFYRIPPHLVADVVELEASASTESFEGVPLDTLVREGAACWRHGDVAGGFGRLFAVRTRVPADEADELAIQKATLTFANAAADLGRRRLAKQLIEDILLSPPHPSILVHALVAAANVWRRLGSVDVAEALLAKAESRVPQDNAQQLAWVRHQRANLARDEGDLEGALGAIELALAAYEGVPDPYGACRGRLLRVDVLDRMGRHSEAIAEARGVVDQGVRHGLERVVVAGSIELGRLHAKQGDGAPALRLLHDALARAAVLDDKKLQFHAHFHLWKLHRAAGDATRAALELEAAKYFARHVDELSPEADEIRGLG